MIRIGLSRWLVHVERRQDRGGEVFFTVRMTPQGSCYRILANVNCEYVETECRPRPVEKTDHDHVSVVQNPKRQAAMLRKIVDELSHDVVYEGVRVGLVLAQGFPMEATAYIVKQSLMGHVMSGKSDPVERFDLVDLVPSMREIIAEREAEKARQEAEALENFQRHQEQAALSRQNYDERVKTSFELLDSILGEEERKTLKEKRLIVVQTVAGTFVVPAAGHGLVRQFDDSGKYIQSHCIVFKDHSIPLGDEILMKVALLKTDPQKFIKTSNKFNEDPKRWAGNVQALARR